MSPPLPPAAPTVFVVDDDDDLRESLVLLVEALGFPARPFADGESFYRQYRGEPGCLVLDIWMPRLSGLELYERLLHEGTRIPAIFITAHADVSTAVAAMKTGAIEFLEKPFDRATLSDRIARALAIDAEWRRRESEYQALHARIRDLTATDRETLALLTAGRTNKSIASSLMITERAVELRRSRLMQKLSVKTLAELLDLTITHRILEELRVVSRSPVNRP